MLRVYLEIGREAGLQKVTQNQEPGSGFGCKALAQPCHVTRSNVLYLWASVFPSSKESGLE